MLSECADCTTKYAAELDKCPHCGSQKIAGDEKAPKKSTGKDKA